MSRRQLNVPLSVTPRKTRSGRVITQHEQTVNENKQKSKQTKSRKNPQRPTAVAENPSLETTTENDLNIDVGSHQEDGQQHPTAEDPTMNSLPSSSATSRRCTRRSSKRKSSSSIIAEDDQETTEALNDEQSTEENNQQQSTEEVNQQQSTEEVNQQPSTEENSRQQSTEENNQQQSTEENDQQPSTSSENSRQLQILSDDQLEQNVETTEDSTTEIPNDSVMENVIDIEDSITENQNHAVPAESINNHDDYVILSDDDDDFVIVPSDDEEDPRINEAVQILEGNLSLNAPSSPSLSPTRNNRTIDLTDSPKASPMPIFMDSPDPPQPSNQESLQIKCPICFDTFIQIKSSGKRLMSTICGHIFCSGCLPVCVKTAKNCPSCRKTLKLKDIHPIFF